MKIYPVLKKLFAVVLVFSSLLTSLPIVQATQIQKGSQFNYIDEATGDVYTYEQVQNESRRSNSSHAEEDTAIIRTYINGEFVEQVYANITTNTLRITYPDGKVDEKRISDVVVITDVYEESTPLSSQSVNRQDNINLSSGVASVCSTTDYIGNEPFTITSRRVQATLPGATTYAGYQAMGYRSFSYPESGYAFLQRKNGGVEEVLYTKKFDIGVGTTASILATILLAAFQPAGMIASIASSLVSTAIGVAVDYACSATVAVVQFRWDYRIRVGSNLGYIIKEHTRLRDYWEMHVAETDSFAYEYRPGYDDGTTLVSNNEMINLAIRDFFTGG